MIAFLVMVGVSRFERPTTRTPSEYATKLRYTPTWVPVSLICSEVEGSRAFLQSRVLSNEC